jgi:hypothetical protein
VRTFLLDGRPHSRQRVFRWRTTALNLKVCARTDQQRSKENGEQRGTKLGTQCSSQARTPLLVQQHATASLYTLAVEKRGWSRCTAENVELWSTYDGSAKYRLKHNSPCHGYFMDQLENCL